MNGSPACQDDFWEKRREELIGGKPVIRFPRSSYNHNRVSYSIATLFHNYLDGKKCTPFASGTTVFLDDENHFVPDFMVVCDPDKIKPNGVHGAPDLVVEVLSPGTAKIDRTSKMEAYARFGVREYWIADPISKYIEVYHTDGTTLILHDIYCLRPDWELEDMTEEERAAVVTHFKCSLFDDLEISIKKVFSRTF